MSARILVVDDIETNGRLLEAKLTNEYYEVLTASDGPTALAIAASEKPDIVTCLDGESVVNSDVTIKLHDKKLNFFGPEGCSCNRTARG